MEGCFVCHRSICVLRMLEWPVGGRRQQWLRVPDVLTLASETSRNAGAEICVAADEHPSLPVYVWRACTACESRNRRTRRCDRPADEDPPAPIEASPVPRACIVRPSQRAWNSLRRAERRADLRLRLRRRRFRSSRSRTGSSRCSARARRRRGPRGPQRRASTCLRACERERRAVWRGSMATHPQPRASASQG